MNQRARFPKIDFSATDGEGAAWAKEFLDNYNRFLAMYNNLPESPNHSDILTTLKPTAFVYLFLNVNPC